MGDTDFRLDGEASFVVIEDRTLRPCDPGKFRLYIWEDLQAPAGVAAPTSWSAVKSLYR
jgi:hypothetical protein